MVSSLFDTYSDDFIPVFYQFSNSAQQPWCWTRMWDFYGDNTVPRMWWEGNDNAGSDYSGYEADILAHRAVPTDVTIDINAFRDGADLDIRASICVEPGGTGKNMRIYVVQILDYYLPSIAYHRNAFRQVATEDVNVAAGACVDVQKFMILKAEDIAELQDVGIVVWAQEPLDVAPADVYQAAYVFDPPGISADGFESGDFSAWD